MYLSLLGNLSLWRVIQNASSCGKSGFDEAGRCTARSSLCKYVYILLNLYIFIVAGTKEADFYGSVKINGAKGIKKNVEYAHVKYNVVENKFVSLEQTSDGSTEYKLTETDPTEK